LRKLEAVMTAPGTSAEEKERLRREYRQKALEDLSRAVELSEKLSESIKRKRRIELDVARAMELLAADEFDKCIKFCDEVLTRYAESMPGSEELIRIKGLCYFALRRLDEAKSTFDEAIERRPNYAEAYYNRGNARYEKGDLDGAIADYNRAIRLNPKDAGACANRGAAHRTKGDLEAAIADFKKALQVAPARWPQRRRVQRWLKQAEQELTKRKGGN
jgi:tetratricopeptide (TPR) repeat protein